jgi:hypothetical protein
LPAKHFTNAATERQRGRKAEKKIIHILELLKSKNNK